MLRDEPPDCVPFWLEPVSVFGSLQLTMLATVHLSWACHPVCPSDRRDAGSLRNLLAKISRPKAGGTLSRQLPTRALPVAPVPIDYGGRNRRFVHDVSKTNNCSSDLMSQPAELPAEE